jgi:hypothetical protein
MAYHNMRKQQAAEPILPEIPAGEEVPATETTASNGG